MKPLGLMIVGAIVGAALVALLGWGLGPDVGRLEFERDSANAALVALQVRAAARAQVDSHRADSITQVLRRREFTVQEARSTLRAALDSATGGDTALAALFERQRASYEGVIAADSAAFVALTTLYDRRLAAKDSTIAEQRAAIVTLTDQRDRYRAAARPNLLKLVLREGSRIAGTMLVCRFVPGENRPC